MLTDLTQRQTLLLNFIRDFIGEKGYSPSVREMMDHMRVNSPNGLMCHLKALKKKGFVEWDFNTARSLQLTDQAKEKAGIPLLTLESVAPSDKAVW